MANLTPYHRRHPRSKWDGAFKVHAPAAPIAPFEARCGLCGWEGQATTYTCPECSSRVTRCA